jgi:hypothetical protein
MSTLMAVPDPADASPTPPSPPAPPTGQSPPDRSAADDEGPGLTAWARQNKLFALLLIVISLGLPFVMTSARDDYLRRSYGEMHDAWQARLEVGGLPVPGLPTADVVPPPPLLQGPLDRLGLRPRQRELETWRALQSGVAAPTSLGQVAGETPLAPALRACIALRAAAALDATSPEREPLVEQARREASLGAAPLRDALAAAALLALGRDAEAASAAELGLTDSPTPAAEAALRATLAEARRRRTAESLAGTLDPSLLGDVARWARAGLALGPLLATRGESLARQLAPGANDLATAVALIDLFDAAAGGKAPGPELQAAWAPVRARIGEVVAARLATVDDDPRAAFDVAHRLGRLDPEADIPTQAYARWRTHLQGVVNDPTRLRRFVARFLELGWLPPSVEAIVASAALEQTGEAGIGAALVDALALVAEAERGEPEGREARAREAVTRAGARLRPLDQELAGRKDPAARRARAQGAALLGRALLAAGAASDAEQAFARADQEGLEPRARLLALRAAAGRRQESPEARQAGVAFARELLALVDGLEAPLAKGLDAAALLSWEVRGWPTTAWELASARVDARVDLAASLLATGQKDEAVAVTGEAIPLHADQAARAGLAHAQALLAAGKAGEARAALEAALRVVRPEERALRAELVRLRDSLR